MKPLTFARSLLLTAAAVASLAAHAANPILVLNSLDANISVIDPTTWKEVKRIPTGKLNAFLGKIQAAHPHPLRGGKQPRILFATQASTRPPRFVIFATGFLEHGYRRYIERCLREEFGFEGSPIQISVNVREKKKRK